MSHAAAVAFLKAVDDDAGLQGELVDAIPEKVSGSAPIVEFARQRGFEFTEREFDEAVAAGSRGELSDDQLGAVAGGTMRSELKPVDETSYTVDSSGSFSVGGQKITPTSESWGSRYGGQGSGGGSGED